MSELRFTLNGSEVAVSGVAPHVTLLNWLRDRGLTGTKEGCGEGECGACAVVLVRARHDGKTVYTPVNSCLLLLASCADQEILTVEGVANGSLHPVQQAMVRYGGSQCGYCTPGFVMSLFAEHYRPERPLAGFDEESIAGNLCRCTGYRPIRDAGRSLPMVTDDDPHARRLYGKAPIARSVAIEGRYYRPQTLDEALAIRAADPEMTIVCGGTDLCCEINQRHKRPASLLSLEAVQEMLRYDDRDDALEIGASVPLSDIEARLHGKLPIFEQVLPLFSSRLIRNRATLGGNLCTASPIGDSPPVLLALGAQVSLASIRGRRTLPVDELFTGYRKTALADDELMVSVRIPKPFPQLGRFYKVSKRYHDDISTVAAGFAIDFDDKRRIARARLAWGGVAATPIRVKDAEAAMIGKPLDRSSIEAAQRVLARALSPMSDQRGSAQYRAAMILSLLDKLGAEAGS